VKVAEFAKNGEGNAECGWRGFDDKNSKCNYFSHYLIVVI
jgi:hypothetical protein